MRTRRLVLKKETLTELGADDLAQVAGGDAATTPVARCVADLASDRLRCDSILRPCITYTCTR